MRRRANDRPSAQGVSLCNPRPCALALMLLFAGEAAAQTARVELPALPRESVAEPVVTALVRAHPLLPPFVQPVFAAPLPDGSHRLVVAERAGVLRLVDDDAAVTASSLLLDLRGRVETGVVEEGVIALAFDPLDPAQRTLHVSYTPTTSECGGTPCLRVERFDLGTPIGAAPARSLGVVIEIPRIARTQNGGMIAFGPDGMLWIGVGDGSALGDVTGAAQSLAHLQGKLLRVDPRAGAGYAIPAGAPFAGVPGALAEIHAFGLRQPRRFSFDRATGALWIADSGRTSWEEASVLSAPGANFGWPHCEGTHDATGRRCRDVVSTPPVLEYPRGSTGGSSITGGVVYRGERHPELFGAYVYADAVTGHVWAFAGGRSTRLSGLNQIAAIVEDTDGELLFVRYSDGRLHRLAPTLSGPLAQLPARLSQTGLFSDLATLAPAAGLLRFDVRVPAWHDGAQILRFVGLPSGPGARLHESGPLELPEGSVLVQHLSLAQSGLAPRPVETRVLLRQRHRWLPVSYAWDAAGTDADLVLSSRDVSIALQGATGTELRPWRLSSTPECVTCHAAAACSTLALRSEQIVELPAPPGGAPGTAGPASQIEALVAAGLLDAPWPAEADVPALPQAGDATRPLGRRVRALLDVRCAGCHRGLGADLDLRRARPLASTRLVAEPVTTWLPGGAPSLRLQLGTKEQSMLWHRLVLSDDAHRMPLPSFRSDAEGAALVGAWIDADPTRDRDGDGVPDVDDVCAGDFDPAQSDADRDEIGDACDAPCANGLDDDGDGRLDHPADAGCQNRLDWASESPACQNGADDDGDGATDWPADATCIAPWAESESLPFARLGCGLTGAEALAVLLLLRGLRPRRRARPRATPDV